MNTAYLWFILNTSEYEEKLVDAAKSELEALITASHGATFDIIKENRELKEKLETATTGWNNTLDNLCNVRSELGATRMVLNDLIKKLSDEE